jgi:hypothetical protein
MQHHKNNVYNSIPMTDTPNFDSDLDNLNMMV